jgi:hypothetical protein
MFDKISSLFKNKYSKSEPNSPTNIVFVIPKLNEIVIIPSSPKSKQYDVESNLYNPKLK